MQCSRRARSINRWDEDEDEIDTRHDKFTSRREQRVKQMLEDTYNPEIEEPVVERPKRGYSVSK